MCTCAHMYANPCDRSACTHTHVHSHARTFTVVMWCMEIYICVFPYTTQQMWMCMYANAHVLCAFSWCPDEYRLFLQGSFAKETYNFIDPTVSGRDAWCARCRWYWVTTPHSSCLALTIHTMRLPKRAIYTLKRVLCTLQRALYSLKRALFTLRQEPSSHSDNAYTQNSVGMRTHIGRIDKNIGLFCRISSLLEGSFARETYNLIDPTDRSHPIHTMCRYGHTYAYAH